MTQEIINNFLLKVGSSRYQDPDFIKKNPGFGSISRFGIGVLSTFMIADSVEIVSCHPDEDQARRLILRSVHGKYLIRLLDKGTGDPQLIGQHGTIFRLHVRPSVEITDIMQTAEHWIVVPDCKVTVQIDDNVPKSIGFQSPAAALRSLLKFSGLGYYEDSGEEIESSRRKIRIVEQESDGVTLAYALTWNYWFKEWSFLTANVLPDIKRDGNGRRPLLGTCVEGIRIVTDTPGFRGYSIVALANVRGASAPKTNVARSGLEMTPERDAMLRKIYSLYAQHIISELSDLTTKQSFSLTWAAGETSFLIGPLMNSERESILLNPKLLHEILKTIPCVLVEENGKRRARSPQDLSKIDEFWTIDCALLSSAESLIREVSSAASLFELVNALDGADFKFPDGPVVCGLTQKNRLVETVFASKEVDQIIVNPKQRRVDLHWIKKSGPTKWFLLPEKYQQFATSFYREFKRATSHSRKMNSDLPQVPHDTVVVEVHSGEIAVMAFGLTYLVPGSDIVNFTRRCIENVHKHLSDESALVAITVLDIINTYLEIGRAPTDIESIRKSMNVYYMLAEKFQLSTPIEESFEFSEFCSLLMSTNWKSYDITVWQRRYFY